MNVGHIVNKNAFGLLKGRWRILKYTIYYILKNTQI